jgi:hypothetical protein
LTPSPEREVLAVARFASLEFLWWLPVVFLAEQLLVGDSTATAEELANFFERAAVNSQGLAHIASHGKRRTGALSPMERLGNLVSDGVVGFWNDLSDHLKSNSLTGRKADEGELASDP